MQYDISVIIPTYNVEPFIKETLLSIKKQVFSGSVEIILVDDCSTDNTLEIIDAFQASNKELTIRIFHQDKNMRQGAARNRGLLSANGEYVLFLDADDFLNPQAFKKMHDVAKDNDLDMVMCDWSYFYTDRGVVEKKKDKFMLNEYLNDAECERLLEAKTYFTVNKLYNRQFLLRNSILYGEGYIYEDYEFYSETAQKASKIGILPEVLYYVRFNEQSTTKLNRNTMIHIDSLLLAVQHTIDKFKPRRKESYYYLYKYLVKKTMNYLHHRAPKGQKIKTLKRILFILNKKKTDYFVPKGLSPLFHLYFGKELVQKERILLLIFVDWLHRKRYLRPIFSKVIRIKNFLKRNK